MLNPELISNSEASVRFTEMDTAKPNPNLIWGSSWNLDCSFCQIWIKCTQQGRLSLMQLRRKRSKEVLFYAQSCLIGGLCEGKSRCSRSWWGAVPLLAGGFFIANLLQLLMRVTLVQAISRSFYLQHTDCNRKPYSCFDCRWSILLWDSIVDSSADWRHWLSLFHLAAREGDVHRPNPSSIGIGEGPQRSCWLGLFNMELMLVYLSTVSLAVTATLTLKAERRPVVTSFSIQMNLMNLIFYPGCIQWPLWHGQFLWLWHWGWK